MSDSFDIVCTNTDCDYSDNIANPKKKGLIQDDPFGTCHKRKRSNPTTSNLLIKDYQLIN